jgi:hypothetical protein
LSSYWGENERNCVLTPVCDLVAYTGMLLPFRPFFRVKSFHCPPVRLSWWNKINLTGQIFMKFHLWKRRTMVQAVSVWPLAAEDGVRSQASLCGICTGLFGTGTGLPSSTSVLSLKVSFH